MDGLTRSIRALQRCKLYHSIRRLLLILVVQLFSLFGDHRFEWIYHEDPIAEPETLESWDTISEDIWVVYCDMGTRTYIGTFDYMIR